MIARALVVAVLAGLASAGPAPAWSSSATTVETADGTVCGFGLNGTAAFLGVPYAQPPVADLRFRPPQPRAPWGSDVPVHNARGEYAPACPQMGSTMVGGRFGCHPHEAGCAAWASLNVSVASEDCLYLNIFAPSTPRRPATPAGLLLPVMLYLHAGEFRYGTAQDSESDWPYFAEGAAILVTANSRLGLTGYGAADALRSRDARHNSTGNYGVQDQRQAMAWVRRNIAAFGGDPARVTIFGESSGGACVGFHLTSPRSQGLFRRAILESPGLTQSKDWHSAESNTLFAASALTGAGSQACRWPRPVEQEWREFPGLGLGIPLKPLAAAAASVAEGRRLCATLRACQMVRKDQGGNVTLLGGGEAGNLSTSGPLLFNWTTRTGRLNYSTIWLRLPDPAAVADCLVESAPADLVALAMGPPYDDTFTSDGFGMTEDGVELGAPLQELVRRGLPPGVDVLAGSNLDEGTEFMTDTPPIACNASDQGLLAWAAVQFGADLGSKVVALYRDTPAFPGPTCDTHAASSPKHRPTTPQWVGAMRAAGDAAIGCRARDVLYKAREANNSAYRYLFTIEPLRSINWPPGTLQDMGAFHGAEVPFVFGAKFELSTPGE